MAGYISDDTRKVTTHRLVEMKQRGEKISMLTRVDYTMAQIVDGAGMDVILVGDPLPNVMAGNVTTLPITLDQMIYHAKSVVRGVKRAMVVVDMPFGSYQGNEMEGLASAIRIMKESHADALKAGRRGRNHRYGKNAFSAQVFLLWDTSDRCLSSSTSTEHTRYALGRCRSGRSWYATPTRWKKPDVLPCTGDSRCVGERVAGRH